MTDSSDNQKFFELDFASEVHSFLKSREWDQVAEVVQEIELAWVMAPEKLKQKIATQPNGTTIGYRGILWELFLWRKLVPNSRKLRYEYHDSGSPKCIDFEVETKCGQILLMEAMSIGPREGESFSSQLTNDKNIDLLRHRIMQKHQKVTPARKYPSILAYANSYQNFMQSIFERFTVLYGKPGIKISLLDDSTELTLTDEGIWPLSANSGSGFSAILYGYGLAPGFSMVNELELWLNPYKDLDFDLRTFPLEVEIFAYDRGMLRRTNRALNFEWIDADIFR